MPNIERYGEARQLLQELSTADGIAASLDPIANYQAIFTRDAVMAGMAGLLIEDENISKGLLNTLTNLRKCQGPQGQIASNFHPGGGASFGSLSPRIDSVSWYVIGVGMAIKKGLLQAGDWKPSVAQCMDLLEALEYNGKDLIYVPMGGNWADEFPYFGFLLYDQALRLWALRLAAEVFGVAKWSKKAEAIKARITVNYFPEAHNEDHPLVYHKSLYKRAASKPRRHLACSFSPAGYQPWLDLAAHSLLAMALGPDECKPLSASLTYIQQEFLGKQKLPPAFSPVIKEGDPHWESLKNYHLFDFRNAPQHYHNGGIWPIWLGWLGMALANQGRSEQVGQLVEILQQVLNKNPGFLFEEYFQGDSLESKGTSRMAYSATGIVFLEGIVSNKIKFPISV